METKSRSQLSERLLSKLRGLTRLDEQGIQQHPDFYPSFNMQLIAKCSIPSAADV